MVLFVRRADRIAQAPRLALRGDYHRRTNGPPGRDRPAPSGGRGVLRPVRQPVRGPRHFAAMDQSRSVMAVPAATSITVAVKPSRQRRRSWFLFAGALGLTALAAALPPGVASPKALGPFARAPRGGGGRQQRCGVDPGGIGCLGENQPAHAAGRPAEPRLAAPPVGRCAPRVLQRRHGHSARAG